jgi:3-keto-disaccharide hydrolase
MNTPHRRVRLLAPLAIASLTATLLAQAAGAPPQGGRGGGVFAPITDVAYSDYSGYTSLWDGRTFEGWDGETDVWSIDNGAIHADTTKTPGQHHLHYKGPDAVMRDFDLKVEFKISATGANGGIQYRSRLLMAPHKGSIANPLGAPLPTGVTTFLAAVQAGLAERAPARGAAPASPTASPTPGFQNPWQVSGYQFDLDSENRFTGQLYEGQGRGIVNPPGGIVELVTGRQNRIGTVNANPKAAIKPHNGLQGDWQQVQIIARGNTLVHVLNGQVVTLSLDDDPTARAPQGILSLQLEGSGQIWYRNVYLKRLGN